MLTDATRLEVLLFCIVCMYIHSRVRISIRKTERAEVFGIYGIELKKKVTKSRSKSSPSGSSRCRTVV